MSNKRGLSPSTRFQGSKLKIIDWIGNAIKDPQFYTALDGFGGTGSIGYMLEEVLLIGK